MPEPIESKSKKSSIPTKTKTCQRCGKSHPLTDYYANKDWTEQGGRDAWCKDCFARCTTKDEVREYFWYNNREFSEKMWQSASAKAEASASKNATFLKLRDDQKIKVLEKMTCQQLPSLLIQHYSFVDNTMGGKLHSYEEAKAEGYIVEEAIDDDVKYHSSKFNGDFKKKELEYLEDYYSGLEQDFDLTDVNLRDIAKKLAKASLQYDKVQADFANGRCDISVVKDAMAQFDMLSKSGNFAACKRRPGDTSGLSSWSEIALKLEESGHPCTRKIEWEEDDVDKTINDFRYLVESLSLDTL